jgi:hypothetical protein
LSQGPVVSARFPFDLAVAVRSCGGHWDVSGDAFRAEPLARFSRRGSSDRRHRRTKNRDVPVIDTGNAVVKALHLGAIVTADGRAGGAVERPG